MPHPISKPSTRVITAGVLSCTPGTTSYSTSFSERNAVKVCVASRPRSTGFQSAKYSSGVFERCSRTELMTRIPTAARPIGDAPC